MRPMSLLSLVLVAASSVAQSPDRTVRMTVSPAAAPSPALKYELLPDLRDLSPGNAALHYYRATNAGWLYHRSDEKFNEKMARWMEATIKELPREELKWLPEYAPLRELERGARNEHCNWELTARLKSDGARALVPEIGVIRDLSLLLALRTRLELSEERFDQAVLSLQTGFSLARHLNEAPTMIFGLTGHALAGMTAREVERFIQQPGAPNLYWALTSLPVPFADLREALRGDRLIMTNMIPDFARLESAVLSIDEARDILNKLYHNQGIFGGGLPTALQGSQGLGAFFPAMMVAKNYSRAKDYLVAHGWAAEKVEGMPAPQVVLLYAGLRSRVIQDEALKWSGVPYWQAQPYLQQTRRILDEANKEAEESLPFLGVAPAFDALLRNSALTDRRIAILRLIEALRLHAAANRGELPTQMGELTAVPIPVDPVTGKALIYELQDGKAIVSTPPVDGNPSMSERYEITIRR